MIHFNPMDEKTLQVLEYPKILERLAGYAAFSASAELARALTPADNLGEALARQTMTSEARKLLDTNADVGVGGAVDIRPLAGLASHAGVLAPTDLLAVKTTLIAARTIARTFERLVVIFPVLSGLVAGMPVPFGLIDAISHAITERGEVADSASPQLAAIRSELRVSHERLLGKLQRLIGDPKSAPMLQEAIITQRDGRYVVPLRAEFKGRIRAIVHDQSSSGATLFVEPLAVVELNNRWKELQLAERDEERRILADLSLQVGRAAGDIALVVETLAALDLALMCAKYAIDLRAVEPLLLPIRPTGAGRHPGSTLRLIQARHPLLDPARVVPTDVLLDPETYAVVITGPNTGGKTVSLKTVGLLVLMAQTGLHIPAGSGSELSVFERVYADIGDEQSIEQSLSTFSGHITNIVHILREADRTSLVVLDELGAGTDPQEGASLAQAILTYLLERQVTIFVATHYPELKTFAHATPGAVNASVEFDMHSLRPTYHLTIGLPGRSNALAIAERLGLPEEIISAARAQIHPDDLRSEDLLDEIHRQRDLARQERAAAEAAQREAARARDELARRLEKIDDERRIILERARREAEDETADLQREIDDVRRALGRARQPLEAIREVEGRAEEIESAVQKPVERQVSPPSRGPLRLGEKVRLRSLKMEGVVSSLSENDAEVQLGALRVRARLADIQRKGEVEEAEPEPAAQPRAAARSRSLPERTVLVGSTPFRESPGMELDLRGQRVEDALPALDRHLEAAFMAGLPFIRIIHGKGTGRLRQVVRQALRESPHVSTFEPGQENEGGDGVTVAHLSSD
jgi:DNA mismatch repair protein MutS2